MALTALPNIGSCEYFSGQVEPGRPAAELEVQLDGKLDKAGFS